jgi:hypothetical protein
VAARDGSYYARGLVSSIGKGCGRDAAAVGAVYSSTIQASAGQTAPRPGRTVCPSGPGAREPRSVVL